MDRLLFSCLAERFVLRFGRFQRHARILLGPAGLTCARRLPVRPPFFHVRLFFFYFNHPHHHPAAYLYTQPPIFDHHFINTKCAISLNASSTTGA